MSKESVEHHTHVLITLQRQHILDIHEFLHLILHIELERQITTHAVVFCIDEIFLPAILQIHQIIEQHVLHLFLQILA